MLAHLLGGQLACALLSARGTIRNHDHEPRNKQLGPVWQQLVFPHPDYPDASFRQFTVILSVASPIAFDLRRPIRPIDVGDVAALGAAVPITPITENDDARSWKEEIRLTRQAIGVHLPATDTGTYQDRPQAPFGAFGTFVRDRPHPSRMRDRYVAECAVNQRVA
jgi:hypothetical protein